MRKSFTTDAINLKSYPLKDDDSIVVMFSKTKGLIRAVAKGAKKPKSKLGARIQMFIANKLMLFEGRNLDTIKEAQSINTFSKIRYDLDKLSYSMYIAEIINSLGKDNYNTSKVYDLIYDVYEAIANSKNKENVLYSTLKFQIKIMEEMGLGLDFQRCSKCMKELNGTSSFFSFDYFSFVCPNCLKEKTNGVFVNNKIIKFLDTIKNSKINQKTKYDELLTLNILEKCFDFMKKYIDNFTNKQTKVFDVLNETIAV